MWEYQELPPQSSFGSAAPQEQGGMRKEESRDHKKNNMLRQRGLKFEPNKRKAFEF